MPQHGSSRSHIGGASRPVVLPLTTPPLVGARARRVAGAGLELLVPDPAGGRGFYIMAAKSLERFYPPTLHDELLIEEVGKCPSLSPMTVRRAARSVALTGAAGRRAARAAAEAENRERTAGRLALGLLLLKTVETAGVRDFDPAVLEADGGSLRSHLGGQLGTFASRLGLTVDHMFDTLEEVARHAAFTGFAGGGLEGEHRRTSRRIAGFADALDKWAGVESEETAKRAREIRDAARSTCESAGRVLGEAGAWLEDVPRLLRLWRDESGEAREKLEACDWLLDGWNEICALWEGADHHDRPLQRTALAQIARLLFTAPDGPAGRESFYGDESGRRRCVRLYEDWRTGVIVADCLQRQEALKAGALA